MDKTTKTILIIVGVILGLGVICCVGGILVFRVSGLAALNAMVVEESDNPLELANRYIDFVMPAGYFCYHGVTMGSHSIVYITENPPPKESRQQNQASRSPVCHIWKQIALSMLKPCA